MVLALFGFGWLWSIFSSFFFWLDSSILGLISSLYDLLLNISRTTIMNQATIHAFADRIQMLLGIFMLFKVSFSLIMYVVNPDDFSDKSKGIGKLAQNTVISLVMLAVVPYIFNMAYKLQAMVLEDNTLARLILGEANDTDYLNKGGDLMAFQVMIPFFQPNLSLTDYEMEKCSKLYEPGDSTTFNQSCFKQMKKLSDEIDDSSDNGSAGEIIINNYKTGVEQKSLGLTFRLSTINYSMKTDDDETIYMFEYRWPLTTVVGVVVCLLLINFCIDIAVRSIKLAFLQLISPIPIISYMDPKNGKDGLFSKWAKMCGSTYLSLFVRLVALYFGIFVISEISSLYDNVTGAEIQDGYVKLFIIIGILFFIKQLPKILESLGIKLDGDGKFNLNPFKKIEEGAIGGKTISRLPKAAAGAAMGLGIGAVGAATGAGAGKWLTGMASGLKGGLTGKKMSEIHKGQVDANSKMREAIANGSTFRGRIGARVGAITGSGGANARYQAQDKRLETESKGLEEAHQNFDNLKSAMVKNIKGGKAPAPILQQYNNLRSEVEAKKAIKNSIKRENYSNDAAGETAYKNDVKLASNELINAENALAKYENKDGVVEYYNMYRSGTMRDEDKKKIKNEFDAFDQSARQQNYGDISNYDAADIADTKTSDAIAMISRQRQEIREKRDVASADNSAINK